VIFFFIIGIFFLKKEAEWSRLEKTREIWSLLTEIINYVQEKSPNIKSEELEAEVRQIIGFINLSVEGEFLKLLAKIAVDKKQ